LFSAKQEAEKERFATVEICKKTLFSGSERL